MKVITTEYTVIKAEDGMFLANADMSVYGFTIVLGSFDSPSNYTEHPLSEWPSENNTQYEIENDEGEIETIDVIDHPDQLSAAKAEKLRAIEAYDVSSHVNCFYYNGHQMWLNRETRASLRNTIESCMLGGRDSLNIWFGDIHINVTIEQAQAMLSALELYAMDCYNITAQHRVFVKGLTTLEEVENFDITADYPEKPSFNSGE